MFAHSRLLILGWISLLASIAEADIIRFEARYFARSTFDFRASHRGNVVGVLRPGVTARILKYGTLPSGNLGAKVRVTGGELAGREVWIYYGSKEKPERHLKIVRSTESKDPLECTECKTTNQVEEKISEAKAIVDKVAGGTGSSVSLVEWGSSRRTDDFNRITANALRKYGRHLLHSSPKDIADYCPAFHSMDEDQRIGFWSQLISGMVNFESNYVPTAREKVVGRRASDKVTGRMKIGEGLMQLAYSDELNWKRILPAGVCDFNWNADSKLPLRDERRTIQNPEKNLTCGIGILNRLVEKGDRISGKTSRGWIGGAAYWAVLRKPKTKNRISRMTRSYCERASGPAAQTLAGGTR